jgi:hypothetical protein
MARNVITVKIESGRDAGKIFILTELPASRAEKWAAKAFLALAKSDVDVPANMNDFGMHDIAVIGVKALGKMSFDELEPLLDEMFTCIQIMPDETQPNVTRALFESDIEDVSTRLTLRRAIFGLHLDFFITAAP